MADEVIGGSLIETGAPRGLLERNVVSIEGFKRDEAVGAVFFLAG